MSTINTNVIVPDVYSALVREKITGKCKVAQFLVNLGELHGKVGETLTMPKWGYIGDAKDWRSFEQKQVNMCGVKSIKDLERGLVTLAFTFRNVAKYSVLKKTA